MPDASKNSLRLLPSEAECKAEADVFKALDEHLRAAATLAAQVWRKPSLAWEMACAGLEELYDEGAFAPPSPYRKRPIPEELRWRVFERDGYRCQRCGSGVMLRADHIIPEVWRGETTLDNLQTLCAPCNSRKGTR